MNIKTALNIATLKLKERGINSPELDSRILLEKVLEKDHSFLLSYPEMPLTNSQKAKFLKLLKRRENNEPIAYILKEKEFFGHTFLVNRNVLIPRPESEFLVEQALEEIKKKEERRKKKANDLLLTSKFLLLDMGTGSGCLIISLAKKLISLPAYQPTSLKFYASDISKKALSVARKNAKRIFSQFQGDSSREPALSSTLRDEPSGSDSNESAAEWAQNDKAALKFVHSDLFSNRLLHKKFNLIIANLPYVPLSDCHFDSVKQVEKSYIKDLSASLEMTQKIDSVSFEPQNAIFADNNGTEVIKKFLNQSKKYLAQNGMILIELDPRNAKEIQKYSKTVYSSAKIDLKKDLAGLDRYLIISK